MPPSGSSVSKRCDQGGGKAGAAVGAVAGVVRGLETEDMAGSSWVCFSDSSVMAPA
ncbi:protein of unknown function [Cupriavidus neocaledonicus]|uniref:Uncharacterized protein n=1 Tax=Cupriavidus neocaledonicus TaxID=1040979 RepID=A0A375H6N2_9BURK|nr:protein of unknown function [Cupriavidus neocaledonicus]